MRVLALDTTSPPGSLALWERQSVVSQCAVQDDRPFGECLPGAALSALAGAGWSLSQVDLFVVGRGPGSLTGLRVGIATAQGLAFASQRPLVGVSALDALAASVCPDTSDLSFLVAAWMDARRGEVFTQLFEAQRAGSGWVEPRSVEGPLVAAPAGVAPRWLALAGDAPLWVVGNGAPTAEAWARQSGPLVRFVDPPPLAGVMAVLGARACERGLAGPPHAVVPLYVRRPDAEVARERRREVDGGAATAVTRA